MFSELITPELAPPRVLGRCAGVDGAFLTLGLAFVAEDDPPPPPEDDFLLPLPILGRAPWASRALVLLMLLGGSASVVRYDACALRFPPQPRRIAVALPLHSCGREQKKRL